MKVIFFFVALFISASSAFAAPTVTTQNLALSGNQTVALSSLFQVTNPSSVTQYQIWQATAGTGNFFVVGGVQQTARTVVTITPAQMATATFVLGNSGEPNINIRAADSTGWSACDACSWSPFSISVLGNAPIVMATNQTMPPNSEFNLSAFFSVTLNQNRPITQYQVISTGGGNVIVDGSVQTVGATLTLTPTQMTGALYESLSATGQLQVRAYDGVGWSDWTSFSIAITNAPAVRVLQPSAGWGHVDTNLAAMVRSENPIPGDRRVNVLWTNNLGRPITIMRVVAMVGLPFSSPAPVGQYLYAVQVYRQGLTDDSHVETIFPGSAQAYTSSSFIPWIDHMDYPDPAFVIQPSDVLHFLIDGYSSAGDFPWQVNFQVFFK